MVSGTFKKYLSSSDIGFNKRRGIQNAPVNMGFSGKIYNGVKTLAQQPIHQLPVSYVTLDESVSGFILDVFQVVQVPSVGELIKARYLPLGMLLKNVADEIATDKTSASSYKQSHQHLLLVTCGADKTNPRADLPWGHSCYHLSLRG